MATSKTSTAQDLAKDWLVRLNAAGSKQLERIRGRSPLSRSYYERLVIAETECCPDCNGIARECRLVAAVEARDFCPYCFGHLGYEIATYDQTGAKTDTQKVYTDSELYHEFRSDGATVFRRCTCLAAQRQYGVKFEENKTGDHGLCAVKRWHLEFTRTHRRPGSAPLPEAHEEAKW